MRRQRRLGGRSHVDVGLVERFLHRVAQPCWIEAIGRSGLDLNEDLSAVGLVSQIGDRRERLEDLVARGFEGQADGAIPGVASGAVGGAASEPVPGWVTTMTPGVSRTSPGAVVGVSTGRSGTAAGIMRKPDSKSTSSSDIVRPMVTLS